MEKEFLDLLALQSRLKEGINCLFPSRIWLKAEVSAVKARNGGHCYLELSQSEDKNLVAKANAVIWSSKYRFIAPYFESVTGSPISEGMTLLVEVQVSYSELYGLSLVINDIDPEYSVGVKELERQRTIERLQSEGLMDMQKELALPLLPYSLAVISAEDAAGYRDFTGPRAATPTPGTRTGSGSSGSCERIWPGGISPSTPWPIPPGGALRTPSAAGRT